MAKQVIDLGSMKGFHIYDDAVTPDGINASGAVNFNSLALTGFLDVIGYIKVRYIDATQLIANTNDWDLVTDLGGLYTNVRISSNASINVTGIKTNSLDGYHYKFTNVGSFNMVFKNQDAGSLNIHRLINISGGNRTLVPNDSVLYVYDSTTQRWRETN